MYIKHNVIYAFQTYVTVVFSVENVNINFRHNKVAYYRIPILSETRSDYMY